MVEIKNKQERDELHKAIWAIAEDLRGAVDGWEFKNFVLGTMFYRYISENLTEYINKNEHEAGDPDFNYADLDDSMISDEIREDLINSKGFFIYPSQLFVNVNRNADNNEKLNETLEKVFNDIESSAVGTASEKCFNGLFDDFDVNNNKLGNTVAIRNERLSKLLHGIANMNLGNFSDHANDTFGDAYEYLMTMYASNAGKSGGEFFTPSQASILVTKLGTVGKTQVNKVYDGCCGSGSLLLKVKEVLGDEGVRNGFYGQEINVTTHNLCRINMFLHNVGFDKFDIACGDTLTNPQHWDDEPFELIISNPPYSVKWAGDSDATLIGDPRFSPAGVLAPQSKADFAFIMHDLAWLAPNGAASIVCFPGIMYRGGAEQKIRKYLVDNNYIDCVVLLADNMFFGTSIPTCILVLRKGKTDNNVVFIDASKECVKVGKNNVLTDENIDRIVSTYEKRENVEYFCKVASYEDIVNNDYNLSVSTYVEKEDTSEKIDINVLNQQIKEVVAREEILRAEIDKIIAEIEV